MAVLRRLVERARTLSGRVRDRLRRRDSDPNLPAAAALIAVQHPSATLPERPFDLLLLDLKLGEEDGLQVLRKIWTEDDVEFRGDFYRIHDFTLKPKPLNTPERPNPEIFQGGNSTAARRKGRYFSDW